MIEKDRKRLHSWDDEALYFKIYVNILKGTQVQLVGDEVNPVSGCCQPNSDLWGPMRILICGTQKLLPTPAWPSSGALVHLPFHPFLLRPSQIVSYNSVAQLENLSSPEKFQEGLILCIRLWLSFFRFILILEESHIRVHTKSLCEGHDYNLFQLKFAIRIKSKFWYEIKRHVRLFN